MPRRPEPRGRQQPAAQGPRRSCADTYAATLGGIAARIYHQAATGRNVAQATHRVTKLGRADRGRPLGRRELPRAPR